jgi:hypothetical protein
MNLLYVRPDGSIAMKVTNATVIEAHDGLEAVEINEPCNIGKSYYENGQIKAKQGMTLLIPEGAAVGVPIVISGIPDGCEVTWPDRVKTTESGDISFDANVPGDYLFVFAHAKYHLVKVVVNVA